MGQDNGRIPRSREALFRIVVALRDYADRQLLTGHLTRGRLYEDAARHIDHACWLLDRADKAPDGEGPLPDTVRVVEGSLGPMGGSNDAE